MVSVLEPSFLLPLQSALAGCVVLLPHHRQLPLDHIVLLRFLRPRHLTLEQQARGEGGGGVKISCGVDVKRRETSSAGEQKEKEEEEEEEEEGLSRSEDSKSGTLLQRSDGEEQEEQICSSGSVHTKEKAGRRASDSEN
ncbi:hypothetical protein EYF80_029785 [Liparis tanakae]|uniref:Uncharacterized protein n=1 Tax=Liparis tanakae TaxID=230148 RepID=A0A4Z2H2B2_9TELE|nr:hypothetical protein EYF80_029785 [Liparis tanakae]